MAKNKKKHLVKSKKDRHNANAQQGLLTWIKDHYGIVLLLIFVFILFYKALSHSFTNWDDDEYIVENLFIQDVSVNGFKQLFSVFVSSHYHPFTLVSLWVDFAFWGLNAKGFALSNIIWHILSTFLVYLIFNIIFNNKKSALFMAVVFAIHPFRVESVTWLSERKDVLYAFFYLSALWQYLKYIKSGFNTKHYIATVLFFLGALLSKATAASLPLVLLLFDYYYSRTNIKKNAIEKAPFFALSLGFGVLAIIAQSSHTPNTFPLFEKLFLITYALNYYFITFFFPLYQSPIIPFPLKIEGLLHFKYYASSLIIPLSIFVLYKFQPFRKHLILGMGLFLFPLILLLIKFPIGPAYLAERYTYIPFLGLTFLVVFFFNKIKSVASKRVILYMTFLWMGFLCVKTYLYIDVWQNGNTVFSQVIKQYPQVSIAHYNKANALTSEGLNKEAIPYFDNAIHIDPNYREAYVNRGLAYSFLGEYEKAIKDYEKALDLKQDDYKVVENMGGVYFDIKDYASALKYFEKVMELNPNYGKGYANRGTTKYMLNNPIGACADWEKAVNFGYEDVRPNLGIYCK